MSVLWFAVPSVEFGREYDHAEMNAPAAEEDGTAGTTGTTREKPLKMARYLNSLNTRPSFDPYLSSDLPDMGGTAMTSSLSSSGLAMDSSNVPMSAGMTASKSTDSSLSALAGTNGLAADLAAGAADFEQNPESDSFFYIEMLLESLARLGKLGLALDVVAQRLPVELHQLVDATIDEVDERWVFTGVSCSDCASKIIADHHHFSCAGTSLCVAHQSLHDPSQSSLRRPPH